MRNEFSIEELKTIIQTMEAMPKLAESMEIVLRPQEAAGSITKTGGKVVFVPKHFDAPRSTSWRD